MASLMQMFSGSRKRVKSTKSKPKTKNMAKRKTSSRRKAVSSGFKNISSKIPIVGKAFRNPTVRNVFAGIGAVSVLTTLAIASKNPTALKIASSPIARGVTAFLVGDIAGAVAQFAQDRNVLGQRSGGGQQMVVGQGGVA